ncbi:MAG: hypothetical protein LCH67_12720 [Bacteroidetes bacterium]|nr:hypothetical protein [Bacteroidota bacterium]
MLKVSKILLTVLSVLGVNFFTLAQDYDDHETFGVQMLNDTIIVKNGQFAFNSFTVNNNSSQSQHFNVQYNLPSGWSFVTNPTPSFEIKRGEFITVPFRISPSRNSLGDYNYPVSIILKNTLTGKEKIKSFVVKIKQNTVWSASLLSSSIVISKIDSLPRFQLKIKNSGNKRELFDIEVKTDLRISLPSIGTQAFLAPGKDTTLTVYISNNFKNSNTSSVVFYVKAKAETQMITGTVYFAQETLVGHKKRYGILPFNLEYMGVNALMPRQGYFYFNIDGEFQLNANNNFTFRYRTNSFSNEDQFNTSSLFLNYQGKKLNVFAGNMVSFVNYQINGDGLKIGYKINNKNDIQSFAVKSRLSDSDILGFKQEYNADNRKSFSTNLLYVKDNQKHENLFFGIHKFDLKFSTTRQLMFTGGYSNEFNVVKNENNKGLMGGYRVEWKKGRAKLQSSYQYYSDRFPGLFKGLKYGSHELSVGSKGKGLYFFSESTFRNPFTEPNEVVSVFQNSSINEHGARLRFNNNVNHATFSYSILNQYQKNTELGKMAGQKLGFNFSTNRIKFNQSLMLNYVKSTITGSTNKNLGETFSVFYQLKYKEFGLNGNYNDGAVYYFDYLNFANSDTKPSSYNLSLSYTLNNKARTFYNRSFVSLVKNSGISDRSLNYANEFFIEIPRVRASFNVYSNINLLNARLAPSLNISFKKALGIPMVFKTRYHSASIFLFKDKNNNDLFDKGEEPVSDVNIQINGTTLQTNKKGMVFLKNVEKGDYVVDFRKIQNLKGWVIKGGSTDTLNMNQNVAIGVPFRQSQMVSGRVVFESENLRNQSKESVGGILIFAINKSGEVVKTATNSNGEFFFNLNKDTYNIQIPTNIFGEGISVSKSIIAVDLTQSEVPEVIFKVTQKKRQINIKKN